LDVSADELGLVFGERLGRALDAFVRE